MSEFDTDMYAEETDSESGAEEGVVAAGVWGELLQEFDNTAGKFDPRSRECMPLSGDPLYLQHLLKDTQQMPSENNSSPTGTLQTSLKDTQQMPSESNPAPVAISGVLQSLVNAQQQLSDGKPVPHVVLPGTFDVQLKGTQQRPSDSNASASVPSIIRELLLEQVPKSSGDLSGPKPGSSNGDRRVLRHFTTDFRDGSAPDVTTQEVEDAEKAFVKSLEKSPPPKGCEQMAKDFGCAIIAGDGKRLQELLKNCSTRADFEKIEKVCRYLSNALGVQIGVEGSPSSPKLKISASYFGGMVGCGSDTTIKNISVTPSDVRATYDSHWGRLPKYDRPTDAAAALSQLKNRLVGEQNLKSMMNQLLNFGAGGNNDCGGQAPRSKDGPSLAPVISDRPPRFEPRPPLVCPNPKER